jgi:hypothetical protein
MGNNLKKYMEVWKVRQRREKTTDATEVAGAESC